MLSRILRRSIPGKPVSAACLTRTLHQHVPRSARLAQAKQLWGNKLVISEEVENAINDSKTGVVALESAIITHGMPGPYNLSTALGVEFQVRSQSSSVPATIAVLDGKIHVGLTRKQIARLAATKQEGRRKCIKVSRRDLAPALASGWDGGTTVAGTMYIANSLGIDVFVTGGIGGVHRGAEKSFDISADLQELSQTPMGVICAGAKSILDIGLTLEVLETLGVNVATIGETTDFPAFYSPKSGFQSPVFVPDAKKAASLLHTSLSLPKPLSTLFAVPIPQQHAAAGEEIQQYVEQAVRESVEQGVDKNGKEVTPWLLSRVAELSFGRAVESNVALIENNAKVGGRLAEELAQLQTATRPQTTHFQPELPHNPHVQPVSEITPSSTPRSSTGPRVLVFGSAAMDVVAKVGPAMDPLSAIRSTAQGSVSMYAGGVGRNIAECATRLLPNGSVKLVAAVGPQTNPITQQLMMKLRDAGMDTEGLLSRTQVSTSACSLILDNQGDLIAGVADMDAAESITEAEVRRAIEMDSPDVVAIDANLTASAIKSAIQISNGVGAKAIFEPTSLSKSQRILSALKDESSDARPTAITPNLMELRALAKGLPPPSSEWNLMVRSFAGLKHEDLLALLSLSEYVPNIWLKRGAQGLSHFSIHKLEEGQRSPINCIAILQCASRRAGVLRHYQANKVESNEIVSTTGAGDSLVGGIIAGIAEASAAARQAGSQPSNILPVESVKRALECARLTLLTDEAVSPSIAPEIGQDEEKRS